jgi:phosphohistidine phosphatase
MRSETVRTLTLIRHAKSSWAKSSWENPALSDHDRPLAPRGQAAAPRIADWLAAHMPRPDLVICSTAARTQATWALLRTAWQPEPTCSLSAALYMAEAPALLAIINQTAPAVRHLALVGHNPGLHELALMLAGCGGADALSALRAKFPTAAVAVITFDVAWPRVAAGGGQLQHFVSPRRLAGHQP